jgi:hypothetical protein
MSGTDLSVVIIQEGAKIISNFIRSRPIKIKEGISQEIPAEPVSPPSTLPGKSITKAESIKSGCIPCSLGHYGTCSGLLNEGVRFARKDGMGGEVSDRINMCLDELNALERVDLRPEMINQLTGWEKELSQKALDASRNTRHSLEAIRTADDLETVAAETQTIRKDLGREWFTHKFSELTPQQQEAVKGKLVDEVRKEESHAPVG